MQVIQLFLSKVHISHEYIKKNFKSHAHNLIIDILNITTTTQAYQLIAFPVTLFFFSAKHKSSVLE